MPESILQSYLTFQHIKVTDESSIDNLKKAVTDIKKLLIKKKPKVITYTLVALDPKIKDTDPVVQEVEDIIIKKWSTFKNNVTATKDKSTTYVRAVILESLSQLAKSDVAFAAMVWHTARDVVQYYHLDAEKNAIDKLLQNVADSTEVEGQAIWGIGKKIQASQFKGDEVTINTPKAAQIDEGTLKQHLLEAAQHSGWKSYSENTGNNPHPPNNQYWAGYFANNFAKGLSDEINSALFQQSKSLSAISDSVKKSLDSYFAELQPFFEEINSSFVSSITANNKRSELIWWKQALYSPRLNASYRGLSPLDTAITTAFDLADQVGPICPISVDYLLRETLKDLQGEEADKKKSLGDWLGEISNATVDSKSTLAEHAVENDERKTLLVGLANAVSKGSEHFFDETGIDSKDEVSLSDLALWLIHGLQANALATAK
ncbi:GTPase-associated system all-helical protein GASH [Roseivirga sp.]|uniref:GTPase-associated system all-helical protein GASH n=1 Tax=Roseivirga sp. TaxID=1964215 RepID=UPI003B52B4B9